MFAVAIACVLAIGIIFSNESKIFTPKNDSQVATASTQYKAKGNILGSATPKLVTTEYTDFECPYCGMSADMMTRLVSEMPAIQVVHHDFPLDSSCNPVVKKTVHKNSCLASLYSRAAKIQGKYWQYNELLYSNQDIEHLNEQKLINLAKKVNLNIEQLKKDAHNPALLSQLKSDAFISLINICPEVGWYNPKSNFISVVFPDPLSPFRRTLLPLWSSELIFSKTSSSSSLYRNPAC
jgi:protein-disulfide isomerase